MKRIKSFKLFEDNEFGDPNFSYLIKDIKLMVSDLMDDYDVRVHATERGFENEKDEIDIDIHRDSRKNKSYIKLNDIKNRIKQILDQLDLDGLEYEIRRVKIIYLDRLVRTNSIEFLNMNKVDIDELLDGPGKLGHIYGSKSSDTGKDVLSSGIGIQSIYVSLQTKEGKEVF
jgi:hypothetical protein